jgi:hypothetical protein
MNNTISRIHISGSLESIENPRPRGAHVISVLGVLLVDRGAFPIELFASGQRPVEELLFFRPGDKIIVLGNLLKTPQGEFHINVHTVAPATRF